VDSFRGIAKALQGNFPTLLRYIPELMTANTEAQKMVILQRNMANGFKMAEDVIVKPLGTLKNDLT
jgi:hypothetical protein